jgi:hypothetical protein
MKKWLTFMTLVLCACSKDEQTTTGSQFISKVFEYSPAPGQFINEEGLGDKAGADLLVGNDKNLVSLGGYGGYIVFGFDHAVTNGEGEDIAIYGNAVGGVNEWSEPGIVMVSQDVNGNGLPDDTWYELSGSVAGVKGYKITYYNTSPDVRWKDNQGRTGAVLKNAAHDHPYYPAFVGNQDSITFTGTLLPSTFESSGGVFANKGFEWGYADCYTPTRYNVFDISWAVDDAGNKVSLKSVDFVKVYTGQNDAGNNVMGEVSTEVGGARDLHIK